MNIGIKEWEIPRLVAQIPRPFPNDLRGIAADDGIWRNVTTDDCPGRDDGTLAAAFTICELACAAIDMAGASEVPPCIDASARLRSAPFRPDRGGHPGPGNPS